MELFHFSRELHLSSNFRKCWIWTQQKACYLFIKQDGFLTRILAWYTFARRSARLLFLITFAVLFQTRRLLTSAPFFHHLASWLGELLVVRVRPYHFICICCRNKIRLSSPFFVVVTVLAVAQLWTEDSICKALTIQFDTFAWDYFQYLYKNKQRQMKKLFIVFKLGEKEVPFFTVAWLKLLQSFVFRGFLSVFARDFWSRFQMKLNCRVWQSCRWF